jgi:hypothetical protein
MTRATHTQRVRFEHGQRIVARDLNDAVAAELASGARHIVGAHSTWGIVLGLEATLRGSRVLEIARGVAYDAWGRTLIIPALVRLDLEQQNAVVVAIGDGDAVAVLMRAPGDVCLGRDVPLAALHNGLDPSVRRYARTLAAPRIGAGSFTTNLTYTARQRMRVIEIDTRGAGFVETPSYTVSAIGDVQLPPRLGPLISVADPSPNGFKVHVRYALLPGDPAVGLSIELRVDWLGVEPRGGCPLAADITLSSFTNLKGSPV